MQKEKESGCGPTRFDGMCSYPLAAPTSSWTWRRTKKKKNKKECVALLVKEWIRKSLSVLQCMYDESQINKQERESWWTRLLIQTAENVRARQDLGRACIGCVLHNWSPAVLGHNCGIGSATAKRAFGCAILISSKIFCIQRSWYPHATLEFPPARSQFRNCEQGRSALQSSVRESWLGTLRFGTWYHVHSTVRHRTDFPTCSCVVPELRQGPECTPK